MSIDDEASADDTFPIEGQTIVNLNKNDTAYLAQFAEECGISVREAARRLILNTGIAAIEGTSLEESVLMHGVISMQQEETRDLFERYLGEDFGGSLN